MKFAKTMRRCLCAGVLSVAAAAAWAGRFSISADGQEVTDGLTNLVWRRCAEGMSWNGSTCTGYDATAFTHEAALQRAAAEAAGSGKAWRLPNIKELSSLVDWTRTPGFDPTAFPATPANPCWSATPNFGDTSYVWVIEFNTNEVYREYRGVPRTVRLVRAGP